MTKSKCTGERMVVDERNSVEDAAANVTIEEVTHEMACLSLWQSQEAALQPGEVT
jgi:hypothetical protein